MLKFLNLLKFITVVPFLAVCSLIVALVGFVFNSFFTAGVPTKKEEQKEDLNQRKEQYKKTAQTIVIDDVAKYINNSMGWEVSEASSPGDSKKRQKQKAVQKRRKRKKLAKKSRRQNRK